MASVSKQPPEMQNRHRRILAEMLKLPENQECADCRTRNPTWASINLGVFLCIRCSGLHRQVGVHITKVRSCTMDLWEPEQIAFIQKMGNARAKAIYEATLPADYGKPSETEDAQNVLSWIRAKYEKKKFYREGGAPTSVAATTKPAATRATTMAPAQSPQPQQASAGSAFGFIAAGGSDAAAAGGMNGAPVGFGALSPAAEAQPYVNSAFMSVDPSSHAGNGAYPSFSAFMSPQLPGSPAAMSPAPEPVATAPTIAPVAASSAFGFIAATDASAVSGVVPPTSSLPAEPTESAWGVLPPPPPPQLTAYDILFNPQAVPTAATTGFPRQSSGGMAGGESGGTTKTFDPFDDAVPSPTVATAPAYTVVPTATTAYAAPYHGQPQSPSGGFGFVAAPSAAPSSGFAFVHS